MKTAFCARGLCVWTKNRPGNYFCAAAGDLSPVEKYCISADDRAFLDQQTRIALRHCGLIDPNELSDYTAAGGYTALKKVLTGMTPEQVIDEIKTSDWPAAAVPGPHLVPMERSAPGQRVTANI